ncbi:MAG: FprA family A-type flavoprotein [Clostridia bacterium]
MNQPKAPVKIVNGIHWVGALDAALRHFDVVMETQYGTSYNAYLVQGTDKTALIDTVKDGFLSQSLELIKQLMDPKKLDYIIIQHTEPDHSGSLAELLKFAPNAKVLCSKPASLYLPHIANRELPIEILKDGDMLDLGDKVLQFISAPFLHWPDTMFTYDTDTGALLTCDAFGCHFAAENVLESRTDPEFKQARRYYYDCIMSPFAPYVAKAVARVKALPQVTTILPSHGPVLDVNPGEAVDMYAAWAAEQTPSSGKDVFVGYVSCYGYTKTMAQSLKDKLCEAGFNVDMAELSSISAAEASGRMTKADAIAIGSPTVNADALPPIWLALSSLCVPLVRGKKAVVFGSYGWSGEAVPLIEQRLTGLGIKVVGCSKTRFLPDEAALTDMQRLALDLADVLCANQQH